MKRTIVSGFFNPLHGGHLDMIEEAKKLGDYLIVIVNNDVQAVQKKGKIILDEQNRMRLVKALRDVDEAATDVIVDAGRLGAPGWPQPLVSDSDVCLLVMESDLPSLAANRSWAASLAAEERPGHAVRILLVGPGEPYRAGEVRRALSLPVLAGIDRDPVLARVFSHGDDLPVPPWWRGGTRMATAAFRASGYVRSLEAATEAIGSIGIEPATTRAHEMVATVGRRSV